MMINTNLPALSTESPKNEKKEGLTFYRFIIFDAINDVFLFFNTTGFKIEETIIALDNI